MSRRYSPRRHSAGATADILLQFHRRCPAQMKRHMAHFCPVDFTSPGNRGSRMAAARGACDATRAVDID